MVNQVYVETIVNNYYRATFELLISLGVDSPERIFETLEIEKGDKLSRYAAGYFKIEYKFMTGANENEIYKNLKRFAYTLYTNLPTKVNRNLLQIRDTSIRLELQKNKWFNPNFNDRLSEIYDGIIERLLLEREFVEVEDVFNNLNTYPKKIWKEIIGVAMVDLLPLEIAYLIKNISSFLMLENYEYVKFRLKYLKTLHSY